MGRNLLTSTRQAANALLMYAAHESNEKYVTVSLPFDT